MKLFFLMASVAIASDIVQEQDQLTIHTPLTINNLCRPILEHLNHAYINNEVRMPMRNHLRLYNYFPHNFTPRIEENVSFHLDDKYREMLNQNQYILYKAVSVPPYNPLVCVIVGLNKKQSEDVAFKSLLYDLNLSIIKPQLKQIIEATK
jgi:hypothetical protein